MHHIQQERVLDFILWFIALFIYRTHNSYLQSAGISSFSHIQVIRLLILLHRFLPPYFRYSAVFHPQWGALFFFTHFTTLYCVLVFLHISEDHNIQYVNQATTSWLVQELLEVLQPSVHTLSFSSYQTAFSVFAYC